jgi:hypothetical protein
MFPGQNKPRPSIKKRLLMRKPSLADIMKSITDSIQAKKSRSNPVGRSLKLPPQFDGARLCAACGHQPQKRSKTEPFKLL